MQKSGKILWLSLGVILVWRVALLVFTAQPVPANDAFFFDGAVINWLLHGHYCNPSLAECYTISGRQLFSAYPPLYQAALLPWCWGCGTSALSVMWFHFALFALATVLVASIIRETFGPGGLTGLAPLFLAVVTFDERPESLAHVFGLTALLLLALEARRASGRRVARSGMVVLLVCALYASPVCGAFYCGVVMFTALAAWVLTRRSVPWSVGIAVVALFCAITLIIATQYPLAWKGFQENAAVSRPYTEGLRKPSVTELLKVARNAPVFLVAMLYLPIWLRRRKSMQWSSDEEARWLPLTLGVAATGLSLMAGILTLLSPNYYLYLLFAQALLAAGLLKSAERLAKAGRLLLHGALAACLLLGSVRILGMSTWGVLCARDVSHKKSQAIVAEELRPFAQSGERIVLSSAFLYDTARSGPSTAVHSDYLSPDWGQSPESALRALQRLRSPRLVLTQFDYYRSYKPLLDYLSLRSDLVSVRVRNTATLPAPDSFPRLQRVVQQISWAPVIVELSWKTETGS